jgi:hypothetical protein
MNTAFNQRRQFTSRAGDHLYETAVAFVRQREMNFQAIGKTTLARATAISKLKRMLDFYRYSPHADLCKMVIKHEADFRELIPNSFSKLHPSCLRKVNGMIDYANGFIRDLQQGV